MPQNFFVFVTSTQKKLPKSSRILERFQSGNSSAADVCSGVKAARVCSFVDAAKVCSFLDAAEVCSVVDAAEVCSGRDAANVGPAPSCYSYQEDVGICGFFVIVFDKRQINRV